MSNTAHMAASGFNTKYPVGTPVKAYPLTREDPPLITRTRSSAWVLGSGEVVVSVKGYAGGISLDHIDVDESRRPAPPALEFRCPDCPMCAKETETDGDSFRCYGCGASWSSDGSGGEWNDPDEPGCPSVIEWYNTDRLEPKHEIIRHDRERCALPLDHHGKHQGLDDWHKWDDDDPRLVSDREAVSA